MPQPSWVEITSADQFQQALDESSERPVVFFKHSLTCPISARAYSEMNRFMAQPDQSAVYRIIVVQHARAVSDELAEKLAIEHESPQLVIVHNGKAVWDASHFDIDSDSLRDTLSSL